MSENKRNARKEKIRELQVYASKVEGESFERFFDRIIKHRLPFLGILDLSNIFATLPTRLVVKRIKNTITFYLRESNALKKMSYLLFPLKVGDIKEVKLIKRSIIPTGFYLITRKTEFIDFMIRGGFEEIHVLPIKILGRYIGIGWAVTETGSKKFLFLTSPHDFLSFELSKYPSIYIEILKPLPKTQSLQSEFPIFKSEETEIGFDNFSPFQHTLIMGESGSGKSKAMLILMKVLSKVYRNNSRIVMLDPHGEFASYFPEAKIIDFKKNYVEPLSIGMEPSPQLTQLIVQLISSGIGTENKYASRVLFYAVHLLSNIKELTLQNISSLLVDSGKRMEFLGKTNNQEIKRFFDEEFDEIYMHHFNDAILPILNFSGEYDLYMGGDKKKEDLLDVIKENQTVVITFDPHFFGRDMIKFLAGAIQNQMYVQAIMDNFDRPTILIVDEFPRVESRIVRQILAETRKFNLYIWIGAQYLGQLQKEVLDAIISNVRNIIAFKLNKEDAGTISSILDIRMEEFFKKNMSETELEEAKKQMFIRLQQRQAIVRLFDGKTYLIPMKVSTIDYRQFVPESVWKKAEHGLGQHKDERPMHERGKQVEEKDERKKEPGK